MDFAPRCPHLSKNRCGCARNLTAQRLLCRNHPIMFAKVSLFTLLLACSLFIARADVAVLTQHNDLARTGANLQETSLNTTNVNTNTFGLIFTRAVDDQIYAQPLIMTNVNIPGKGKHNLVMVATVNDSVYAFDADDPSVSEPYWRVNFLGPNAVPPRNTDMTTWDYQDFSGNCGIVGTPVINPLTGTIYLVARTKEYGTNFVQRLHALDIRTGAERSGSPVVITATCPGSGSGSAGGLITFDSQRQNQRPALALINGIVYIAWASHGDWSPYHGWLIGYDAATLQQTVVYNTTPDGYNGGIWMSGQAPAADAKGNLYVSTGNGSVGRSGDPRNLINRGESFLKLTPNGNRFKLASWFTPYNFQNLENQDYDLGSGGILLIPRAPFAFGGGKEGKVYLVNRDHMGGLSASTNADINVLQSFQVTDANAGGFGIYGAPVWWDGPDGSYAYLQANSDYLRQYEFNRMKNLFLLPAYAQSRTRTPHGMPGGILSISARGKIAGSGIVWASQPGGNANLETRPGILHAYNAQNVSIELWNSEQNGARDAVGNFAKFVPPTVANGKVYLATFSNRLNVYGLPGPTSDHTNPPSGSPENQN